MSRDDDQLSVDGALEHLVNQFSDPLSFLRELVQNSIDAGSREVDVRFELVEGEGDRHTMIIHVDDYGEGMDREIIDTKLTRLFSSSKDGDLTKIGRFGIGFASVFAIGPDAVCLDTSRGGESWRVLFHRDRTFSRIERDEPVEGTKVQVVKAITGPEFEATRRRARDVISYWCKHVDVELRFDGEQVNQPLDLDLPVKVSSGPEETDATVVAGYTRDGSSFAGFYNKGLTLLETAESDYPGVAFKVSSRYLEHTLTRDTVLHDESYSKALGIVDRLVRGPLIERLFELLDASVRGSVRRSGDEAFLQGLVALHLAAETPRPSSTLERAILRTTAGRPVDLEECLRAAAKDRLLRAAAASPLTDALEARGYVVASTKRSTNALLASLRRDGAKPALAAATFCLPLLVDDPDLLARWAPLRDTTEDLLRGAGAKVAGLELGRLGYEGSGAAGWPAVSQRVAGELTPCDEARVLGRSLLSRKRVLVVNADHATVARLIALAPREPELAAYTLAKLFFLGRQLDPELDSRLAALAIASRCRRQAS
jgi:hypothetical protein